MKKDKILNFENHIEKNLKKNGFDLSCSRAGVAVSGGADSVSLFIALAHICKRKGIPLYAVTVNHNIRSSEESSGDVQFVLNLAKELKSSGYDVHICVKEILKGEVFRVAEERKNGIEEAARFLRYNAFLDFYKEEKLSFIALAHNKNDQIETLLMRFLQGSGNSGLCGIMLSRDFYVRPLLDISRSKIEEYLLEQGFSWRTDSTNFDVNYTRNRIRQKLIPFLNENFPGFEKALLNGAEKALQDENAINSLLKKDLWSVTKKNEKVTQVECSLKEFSNLPLSIKRRQIYSALDYFASSLKRVSFAFINEFISLVDSVCSKKSLCLSFNNKNAIEKYILDFCFCIECKKNPKTKEDDFVIKIKKNNFVATEIYFFVIIESDMQFSIPFGSVCAKMNKDGKSAKVTFSTEKDIVILESVPVPFCVRNRELGDVIKTALGSKKAVSDILSDWHVSSKEKELIPIVQELSGKNQEIIAVLGSLHGFKNWIVKNCDL